MQEKIEYCAVLVLVKVVKILPVNFVYLFFEKVASLLFHLLKRRRQLSIKNLSLAYPKLDAANIKKMAHENFINIGTTVAEICLMLNDRFDFDGAIINKQELDSKAKAMLEKNKNGVIFIAGHFGNWELLPLYFAKNFLPLLVIGRQGNNALIEENLTKPFRERFGSKNIYKNEAMMRMVKALKNQEIIGILFDQKAGKKNSTKTTFFGHECYTTTSVAMLKLKYNPMIVPAYAVRKSRGKFKIIFDESIEYIADELDSKEDKVQHMTQRYNNTFEEVIRQAPKQWFWMHNRWKM